MISPRFLVSPTALVRLTILTSVALLCMLFLPGTAHASLGLVATASAPSPEYPELNSPCSVYFSATLTGSAAQEENPADGRWRWYIQSVLCSIDGGATWQTVFSADGGEPVAASGAGFDLAVSGYTSQDSTLQCSFSEPAEWDITLTVTYTPATEAASAVALPQRSVLRRRLPGCLCFADRRRALCSRPLGIAGENGDA